MRSATRMRRSRPSIRDRRGTAAACRAGHRSRWRWASRPAASAAQSVERSGKEVVAASCVACHGSGANGAPKIGDKKAWAKRAAQGLTSLTANALKGIRQMPPHGGNPNLTDTEIERAITYMVNQSGGHWTEPVSRTTKTPSAPASRSCRHGASSATRRARAARRRSAIGPPGSRASSRGSMSWSARRSRATAACRRAADRPTSPIPKCGARSSTCSTRGTAPAGAARRQRRPPRPRSDATHKVVAGTAIDLGIVSAESIRAQHPKPDAESSMHGGIPSGRGFYHVNISLRDAATNAEIRDAEVEVRVAIPSRAAKRRSSNPWRYAIR